MESLMCISVQLALSRFFYLLRHNSKNFMIWLFCVIAFHIGAGRVIYPWDKKSGRQKLRSNQVTQELTAMKLSKDENNLWISKLDIVNDSS